MLTKSGSLYDVTVVPVPDRVDIGNIIYKPTCKGALPNSRHKMHDFRSFINEHA